MFKVTILQGVRNVHFLKNLACFVFLLAPFRDSLFCLINRRYVKILFYIIYVRLFLTAGKILARSFACIMNRKICFFFSSEHYIVAWSRQGMPKDLEKLHNLSCLFTVCVFLCLLVFNNEYPNPIFIAGPENSFIVPVISHSYESFWEDVKRNSN